MIADLSELHEYTHDAEKITVCENIPSLVVVDVLIVQQPLSPGQVALNNMFNFLRQLFFNIALHATKQKRSKNGLQFLNNSQIETFILIDGLAKGVLKPLFEVLLV